MSSDERHEELVQLALANPAITWRDSSHLCRGGRLREYRSCFDEGWPRVPAPVAHEIRDLSGQGFVLLLKAAGAMRLMEGGWVIERSAGRQAAGHGNTQALRDAPPAKADL